MSEGDRGRHGKTTARSGLVSEGDRGRHGKTTARSGLASEGDRGRQQPGVDWCQETENEHVLCMTQSPAVHHRWHRHRMKEDDMT